MANGAIGVKAWRNYSSFSLFAAGSQRADRNTSILVDTYSGNLAVLATDWNLAARIPCSLTRAYNHQDSTSGVDRPFGPGWYWQYDMNLTGSMNGTGNVTWKAADGSEYEFTYSAGSWTAPSGMHKYKLSYASSVYTLKVGLMKYLFTVNATDSRARLTRIEDAFGNGLIISRTLNGNSEPTATISVIQIRFYNGSSWTTHDIVTPTYSGSLISKLRLDDTVSGGNYIEINYSYSTIDGASRLVTVEPKRNTTALNLETKYDYNTASGKGLEMTKLYDTNGAKAGTPYYWEATYSSGKVASIIFPIDSTPTTGTVSYTYATSAPASWSHASPSAWNKVTDAVGGNWYYGQDTDGRVVFAVSPMWVNSTYEAYTEYAYNSDNQVTSVKTPKPNADSGQLTTSYYYNSNKNLAAVVDHYGFVSWYKYGSRASYDDSGTGATIDDIIGTFALMPNQKAYSDTDHTSSETTAPSLSSPLDVDTKVSWDSTNLYWKYSDGSASPKTIKLVRTVMDYTFNTGTGQLTELLSCSPENFAEASATTYDLTSASACAKQSFDATVGDMEQSYTPRQFMDGALGYTAYTYDQTYGVVTEVETADSIANSATKKTLYTYNAIKTRVTKVQLPQDNTNQWTETIYDADTMFALKVKRPDIQSWGLDPIVSISVFDYNGNATQSWQAIPGATPANWNGSTGSGGYEQVLAYTYDRLNRLIQSDTYVDLDHDASVNTLTSTFTYDKNGNRLISRTPGYDVAGTTNYGYVFTEYDAANRVTKGYNQIASTNASLGTVTGGTKFVSYDYDVAGNAKTVYDQLYTSGSYNKTDFTFDWMNRQIKVSQAFTTTGTGPRVTQTHFAADDDVYWSEDGEGYKMWPERDDNGRLTAMHRGTVNGEADLREYDYNGNLLHYFDYVDVNTDSSNYRVRNKYDMLDRLVNSGRERKVSSVWSDWNSNLADNTFNYNGWALKSFDKVNSAGTYFTERTYDNWGRMTQVDYPQVTNSSGSGNSIYNSQSTYDVLGRRTVATDLRGNDTTYVYDQLGRVIEVTDAESYSTETFFDPRGNTKQVDSPSGASTKYTYNGRNLLEKTRVSHDSTDDDTTYAYDDIGRMTSTTYPDGGVSTTTYDQIGRRQTTSSLLSGSDYLDTDYVYDNNNRLTLLTMPGGYTQAYVYDDLGNMTQSTDSNGDDTDYTYDKNNRRVTETQPNGLVTTWTYGSGAWKTQSLTQTLKERNTTSGDDITETYTYDNNGRNLTTVDGRGNTWTNTWDAMGRRLTLVTPNPGGGVFTHYMYYDGNGNISKTTDFKSVSHYYAYDGLNRMTGHGSTSGSNDETYTFGCCNSLLDYTDAMGTSDLQYDQLNRLISHQDSNGNTVSYTYDSMGRVTTLTPAQGSNYRTEYLYNKNGSVSTVKVYVSGSNVDTSYTYDTTSGKLTQRNDPVRSSANIRITYGYDSAGRLETETVTRESGGATNLYKTTYAYSYIAAGSGGGREILRTEQTYSGGWVNDNKVSYKLDALGRQNFEERHDWSGGAWAARYDVSQEYDKNGNRTRYHRNVTGGYTGTYGRLTDLSYTYDAVNRPTSASDADSATYSATFTVDANGNITQIEEAEGPSAGILGKNKVFTYFTMDALNRVTETKTKRYVAASTDWQWTKISHQIDAIGRTSRSNYRQWLNGGSEPAGDNSQHVYDKSGRFVQNYDGTSAYGQNWHWAGAANSHNGPLYSPAADSASQVNHNIGAASFKGIPVRRSFSQPTVEGDKRELFGQGRPQAKDSVAAWATGISSDPQNIAQGIAESRFSFIGTVAATDMSRASDSREAGRIGIFGSALSYGGSYGRVTNEAIGRDVNPLGRGGGVALVGGMQSLGKLNARLPLSTFAGGLRGNSSNNGCNSCGDQGMSPGAASGYLLGGRWDDSEFRRCAENCWKTSKSAAEAHDCIKKNCKGLPLPPKPPNPYSNTGKGDSVDNNCWVEWYTKIRDSKTCTNSQCVNCPCELCMTTEEWASDPNGCAHKQCECMRDPSSPPGCKRCYGCGHDENGVPCCPTHCVRCADNSPSPCDPCPDSTVAAQVTLYYLAVLAAWIALYLCLSGPTSPIAKIGCVAAFLYALGAACNGLVGWIKGACNFTQAKACECACEFCFPAQCNFCR